MIFCLRTLLSTSEFSTGNLKRAMPSEADCPVTLCPAQAIFAIYAISEKQMQKPWLQGGKFDNADEV
jgi:hypothetical protein